MIILTIFIGSRINHAIMLINNMHMAQIHDAHSTRHNLWELTNRIDQLQNELQQAARPTFNETIQILHHGNGVAETEISFYLRQHTVGDTITVTARGQSGQVTSAVAVFTNGRFHTTLPLPLRDNYAITFAAEGATIQTGELLQFNLENTLLQRFAYWPGDMLNFGSAHNPIDGLVFNPMFRNFTEGNEMLNVRELTLYVETFANGVPETIATWDLMPYLRSSAYGQGLNAPQDAFSISINHNNADTGIFTRLVIYDYLGLRYEQVNEIFTFLFGRPSAVAGAPAPVREIRIFDDGSFGVGGMRIVE